MRDVVEAMEQTVFLATLFAFLWLRVGERMLVRLVRQGRLRVRWGSWQAAVGVALWPWVLWELRRDR